MDEYISMDNSQFEIHLTAAYQFVTSIPKCLMLIMILISQYWTTLINLNVWSTLISINF